MREINKPNRCPKCGRQSMQTRGKRKSKYKAVILLKGHIDKDARDLTSAKNTVGWLCKNCGTYELSFIPEDYKKYLEEAIS